MNMGLFDMCSKPVAGYSVLVIVLVMLYMEVVVPRIEQTIRFSFYLEDAPIIIIVFTQGISKWVQIYIDQFLLKNIMEFSNYVLR